MQKLIIPAICNHLFVGKKLTGLLKKSKRMYKNDGSSYGNHDILLDELYRRSLKKSSSWWFADYKHRMEGTGDYDKALAREE